MVWSFKTRRDLCHTMEVKRYSGWLILLVPLNFFVALFFRKLLFVLAKNNDHCRVSTLRATGI